MQGAACIALDLDNTIVAYDALFVACARERGLVPGEFSGTKQLVRDAVRGRADGERQWQMLQAVVYGERMACALPFTGARDFIVGARSLGARVVIVSHKTEYATARPDGVNLHRAARAWLAGNAFTGANGVAGDDVYFEPTRERKIERIGMLGATIVIDDLLEVLTDPAFPSGARRWLFEPGRPPARRGVIESFDRWAAMFEALKR